MRKGSENVPGLDKLQSSLHSFIFVIQCSKLASRPIVDTKQIKNEKHEE